MSAQSFPKLAGIRFDNSEMADSDFGIDTGGARRHLMGAAHVLDRSAVPALIEYARTKCLALWPVSGGRNYGYGTALPVQPGSLVVDLSGLRQIEYDAASGTFTVEPGVTQHDMDLFLQRHNLPYLVPTTGVGPHGSLLGNALDGGYGLTPIADHFEAISCLEGIWGNGQRFAHTFASLQCDDMARRWPAGVGPSLQGLFRQGCFGIVTRGTLRLARTPEACAVLVLEWPSGEAFFRSQTDLSRLTEELPLLGGIISMNGPRVLSTMDDAPLTSPLTGSERQRHLEQLCQAREIAPWTGVGTLYGPRKTVRAAISDIRRRLPLARVWAFTPGQIRWLQTLVSRLPARWFAAKRRHVGALLNMTGTVEGRPITAFLRIAYALEPKAPDMNLSRHPARDGQGILWFAPLVPLTESGVRGYTQTMARVLVEHGFDPLLAVTTRSTRVHSGTIPLLFRKTPEGIERARTCYQALVDAGISAGMPPYRLGIDFMPSVWPRGEMAQTWAAIQRALDPQGVIAPGRYLAPLPPER